MFNISLLFIYKFINLIIIINKYIKIKNYNE